VLVYGLTGGIGSGKSAVGSLLAEYGIPVVSADELSRMVVAPGSSGLGAVVEAFGAEVLAEDGSLDRRAMAAQIFADAKKRKTLESILHPKIRESFQQVLAALEQAGHEVVVYEVPLLFEKGHEKDLHAVILVTAPDWVRIERVQRRDSLAEDEVRARMQTQMPEAEKRTRADYVIDNTGDLDDLRREVQLMLPRFLKVQTTKRLRLLATADVPEREPAPSSQNTLVGEVSAEAPPSDVHTRVGPLPAETGPHPASAMATAVGPAPSDPGAPSSLETAVGPVPGTPQTPAHPAAPMRQPAARGVPRPGRGEPRPGEPSAPPVPGAPPAQAAAPKSAPLAPPLPGALPPPPKTGES
jgi:dephospho-CoA kinase